MKNKFTDPPRIGTPSNWVNLPINFPPEFRVRYGHATPAKYIDSIICGKAREQQALLESFHAFRPLLASIAVHGPEDSEEPRWGQDWIPPLDGISIYCLIAQRKPGMILEIGSGNSTKFARRAIRDLGLATVITSIDPAPRAECDAISDHVIRKRLEDCESSVWEGVSAKDLVFVDCSHRCLQNSDVTAFFIDVLPSLPRGTLVGVHDIFWPYDYPEAWLGRYYSEQYILGAYMLALKDKFPLVLSNAWAGGQLAAAARACLSPDIVAQLPGVGGGCLWFEAP